MSSIVHVWQGGYPWEVRVGKINRSLRMAGHDVTVVARKRKGELTQTVIDDIKIQRTVLAGPLSLPVPANPLWGSLIATTAREQNASLILVRDIPLALDAAKVARKLGLPIVMDMAEHYPEAMRSWDKYGVNPILRKLVHGWKLPDLLERKAVAAMDGIIVVCQEQKERLNREYGFADEKICVAMNTPELEAWTSFRKGRIHERPKAFGYHGILCEDRELEVVLAGFEIAAAKDSEITLLLAGGGESEHKLRKLAGHLSARDRITFTGRYAPEKLASLYSAVDYGIVSLRANKFTEHTLANKFFDYAALGKPFIFPAIKPLQSVMQNMNCGVEFNAGSAKSAAEAFLRIREMNYDKLSHSGIKAVEHELNWAVDSKRLLSFLENYGVRVTKRS